MKNQKKQNKQKIQNKQIKQNTNEKNNIKNINLPNDEVKKIFEQNYYYKTFQDVDNSDVTINHLENIFTNETYYLAMKIVPLLERKVLYLSYVENVRLNDICKRLKLPKNKVIYLRNQGIIHFKNNLQTLYRAENMKRGGNN